MITEGIGTKAPQKIGITMTREERMVLFRTAQAMAVKYAKRSDQWGKGLKPPLELPGMGTLSSAERPFYPGLCGEYAVMRFIENRFPIAESKCVVDTSLRDGGDFGVDLTAYGLKLQVKTRQRADTSTLFKRANNVGRTFSINAHVCAFCQWSDETPTTWLLGWQWTEAIVAMPLVQSQWGHWNAEVPDTSLFPMSALADELDAWRQLRQCH